MRVTDCCFAVVFAFSASCGSGNLPPIENPRIDDLAWIEGDWVHCDGERKTWERWRRLSEGLVGRGIVESAGQEMSSEDLHIDLRGGVLMYVATRGGTSTEFALVRLTRRDAVFENAEHDHPQRIAYRLSADGTSLRATVGQLDGSRRERWSFHKDECPE